MLRSLEIQNLALIESLQLEFDSGLNIITGETGAGKSILIDALGFALGQRATVSLIRDGAERCVVQAVFEFLDENLGRWNRLLEKKGLPAMEGELWMKRELNSKGRGRAWINGESVPLAVLTEIGTRLVDFHGQHENQSLLRPTSHLRLLDRFAGLEGDVSACRESYRAWNGARQQRESAWVSEEERLRRLDMLRFQVKELEDAGLKSGEWEELKQKRNMAASAEKRAQLLHELEFAMQGGPGASGAKERLESALGSWRQMARLDPAMESELERLESVVTEVKELALLVSDYQERLEFDPGQLERDETRLAQLENLSRKYGENEEAMLAFFDKASEELRALENIETEKERLKALEEEAREAWLDRAKQLSKARAKASKKLGKAIAVELAALGMEKAVFEAKVEPPKTVDSIDQAAGPEGFDKVEFLLSANPGQAPKGLGKAASGGEISRVMLAIKTALVDVDQVDTLVFDEIDSGVSGRVAEAVGERLDRLAAVRQLFVITHLPQVASRPARHFQVSKSADAGSTHTAVAALDEDGRVREVAAMIDGKAPSPSGLEHARQLLTGAKGNG